MHSRALSQQPKLHFYHLSLTTTSSAGFPEQALAQFLHMDDLLENDHVKNSTIHQFALDMHSLVLNNYPLALVTLPPTHLEHVQALNQLAPDLKLQLTY